MTRVHNIRKRGYREGDVYVGRAGHGLSGYFGNPVTRGQACMVCGEDHEARGSTLPCFEVWARQRIEDDPEYRERVQALHGKDLVCFCAPRPCHGSILARLASELNPTPEEPNLIMDLFGR